MPYGAKLASAGNTVSPAGDTVSQLELRCNGPVYSAATFPATVSSRLKPDSKKRATTNEIKGELEHEQGGEAAVELLPWSLMLQLA